MIDAIIKAFGIEPVHSCESFGDGMINRTYLLRSGSDYVLQRINHLVFKEPEAIAGNMRLAAGHLKRHHPSYLFVTPLTAPGGQDLVRDEEGYYWRLMPFVPESISHNTLNDPQLAWEAASGFGKLTANLQGADISKFRFTIPDFHNLQLRFRQLHQAVDDCTRPERLKDAETAINHCMKRTYLTDVFNEIINQSQSPEFILHHDTKINNILFSQKTGRAICPIDMDTLMPGYLFSDLGDMMRTYVCPVSEEEKDPRAVSIRKEYIEALYSGYMGALKICQAPQFKSALLYAGAILVYMQSLRFLADFLNGDTYYKTEYPGQNLFRTHNQLALLVHIEKQVDFIEKRISQLVN